MSALAELKSIWQEVNALNSAKSLMAWDLALLMPSGGASARGEQSALLSGMVHERLTSDQTLKLLDQARGQVESEQDLAYIRGFQRSVNSRVALPKELVARRAKVTNDAYWTWKIAKPDGDFEMLRPHLAEVFEIAREMADLLKKPDQQPYDALLDEYEEGAVTADVEQMFDQIREPIIDLVAEIKDCTVANDDLGLQGRWNDEALRGACAEIAKQIGFDFTRGRLDVCANAFCSGTGPTDIRMTTRPSEHIKGILSSSLHEMGHALYEQNVNPAFSGTPIGGGTSLAVHESQSRLWENIIGRSEPFWRHFLPVLQAAFPKLASYDSYKFGNELSKIEPSYIRVGADELTYNLHILIRFEIEVLLIQGGMNVKDLPDVWNEKYRKYLGITPPHAGLGCIQDVHWTKGSVGYFPTYAMGNLIGAQMWECLCRDIPNTEELMAEGDYKPILGWLVERVYQHGSLYTPSDLVSRVTGKPMEGRAWLDYAADKYRRIYQLG